MKIAEIRDLDGPNLFLLRPAIKLEVDLEGERPRIAEAVAEAFVLGETKPSAIDLAPVSRERVLTLLVEIINVLHDRVGQHRPDIVTRTMEEPGHEAVAFGWERRDLGKGIARAAFGILTGQDPDMVSTIAELTSLADAPLTADQEPEMMSNDQRRIPIVGITGTNGKTTTTRLLSAILMHAGMQVGWTSSAGVYIQGECVLEGDFTGPAGAARVFEESGIEVGVLETARGGILLRGLGYESNDVSVVTNISADHLGLHGVYSVEELAKVKQVVAAVTRPDGMVVLNAGDPLVLEMLDVVRGRPFLIGRDPTIPALANHVASGGWALWVRGDHVQFGHDGVVDVLTDVNDIPITFGGKAVHMLENALCAAAAALALGLDKDQVASGLAVFRNEVNQNKGRLNVFEVNGATVIVDFAHNTAGLKHLLNLGRAMTDEGGKLYVVVGSAGDRPDDALEELGRVGASQADVVIVKDTYKYLRGRERGDIPRQILLGTTAAGVPDPPQAEGEFAAFEWGMDKLEPGDTLAIMCIEDFDRIVERLTESGTPVS
ncbi:MAG TPA: Mur ligase family protein [Thermomicrobiales bacterium]|nr:Mur ligase family protein [Thermomicrobiales bacterium]